MLCWPAEEWTEKQLVRWRPRRWRRCVRRLKDQAAVRHRSARRRPTRLARPVRTSLTLRLRSTDQRSLLVLTSLTGPRSAHWAALLVEDRSVAPWSGRFSSAHCRPEHLLVNSLLLITALTVHYWLARQLSCKRPLLSVDVSICVGIWYYLGN